MHMKMIQLSLFISFLSFMCHGMEADGSQELNDALIEASKRGDEAKVFRLLDNKAHVNQASPLRSSCFAPLHFAVLYNRVETIKLLVHRNANVNQIAQGQIPLEIAAGKPDGKAARFLISQGAIIGDMDLITCFRQQMLKQAQSAQIESQKLLNILRLFVFEQ